VRTERERERERERELDSREGNSQIMTSEKSGEEEKVRLWFCKWGEERENLRF